MDAKTLEALLGRAGVNLAPAEASLLAGAGDSNIAEITDSVASLAAACEVGVLLKIPRPIRCALVGSFLPSKRGDALPTPTAALLTNGARAGRALSDTDSAAFEALLKELGADRVGADVQTVAWRLLGKDEPPMRRAGPGASADEFDMDWTSYHVDAQASSERRQEREKAIKAEFDNDLDVEGLELLAESATPPEEDEGVSSAMDSGMAAASQSLRTKILDQGKRYQFNMNRMASIMQNASSDGGEISLDDFLDDDVCVIETSSRKLCYERMDLHVVVPMTIKAILLYHAFQPENDSNFEQCLSKVTGNFRVSGSQIQPLWDDVSPLNAKASKEALLRELKRQRGVESAESGSASPSTLRMISLVENALEEIRNKELEAERKRVEAENAEKAKNVEKNPIKEVTGFARLLCPCFFDMEAERKKQQQDIELKAKNEIRRQEIQRKLDKERAEREARQKHREAMFAAVFSAPSKPEAKESDSNESKDDADTDSKDTPATQADKPLPPITGLDKKTVLKAYRALYGTLLEVDNAVATRRFREFGPDQGGEARSELLLSPEAVPLLTKLSTAILNRFCVVYGVDPVPRYLSCLDFVHENLSIQNTKDCMDTIRTAILELRPSYEMAARKRHEEMEAKNAKSDNDTISDTLLRVPGSIKRAGTTLVLKTARPVSGWTRESMDAYMRHVVRSFQWAYWCLSRYHFAFSVERRNHRTKGFTLCVELLGICQSIMRSYSTLSRAVLEQDEKYIEQEKRLESAGETWADVAGYARIPERPFYVRHADRHGGEHRSDPLPWSSIVAMSFEKAVLFALRCASMCVFEDLANITRPKTGVHGDLKIKLGVVGGLSAIQIEPKTNMYVRVSSGSREIDSRSRRPLEDGKSDQIDYEGEELVLKNISIHSPVSLRLMRDFWLKSDQSIGYVSTSPWNLARDAKAEVNLSRVEIVTSSTPSSRPDGGFSNWSSVRSAPSEDDGVGAAQIESKDRKQPLCVRKNDIQQTLKCSSDVDGAALKVPITYSLTFEESEESLKETTSSDASQHGAVLDAPQLIAIIGALKQELACDRAAAQELANMDNKQLAQLDVLSPIMSDYFVKIRVAAITLLTKEQDDNKGGIISTQMLALYKEVSEFFGQLKRSGYRPTHGSDNLKIYFSAFVDSWVECKRERLTSHVVPTILADEKWSICSKSLDLRSPSIVSLRTHLALMLRVFRKLPFTKNNEKTLFSALSTVLVTQFMGGIAASVTRELELEDTAWMQRRREARRAEQKMPLWGVRVDKVNGQTVVLKNRVISMINTLYLSVAALDKLLRDETKKFTELEKAAERVDAKARANLDDEGKAVIDVQEISLSMLDCSESLTELNREAKFDEQGFKILLGQYGLSDLWGTIQELFDGVKKAVAVRVGRFAGPYIKHTLDLVNEGGVVDRAADFSHGLEYVAAFAHAWKPITFSIAYCDLMRSVLEDLMDEMEVRLLGFLQSRVPDKYQEKVHSIALMRRRVFSFFGVEMLNLPEKELRLAGEGAFHRITEICKLVSLPSSELMKSGGVEGVREGKLVRVHEKERRLTSPYLCRKTVLNILKYRYYKLNDKSITKDFLRKNDILKGMFEWY